MPALSTASLARASGRHPWTVIGAWAVVLLVAGALIFAFLSDALTAESDFRNDPESKRGEELLEERLRGPQRLGEIVIVRSETWTADDTAFQAYVEGLYRQVMGLGNEVIEGGVHYYLTQDPSLVSADRDTTVLPFIMAGTPKAAEENIERVLDIIETANRDGPSEFRVYITGEASMNRDFEALAEKDLRTGESIGVSLALIILLVVFGAVAAAIIPLVLAAVAIVAALGSMALVGQVFNLSFFITNMVTMMGLAVGIDYSLFVVSRFREERQRGLEKIEAIAATGATASRAVLFSGMTVIIALLGVLTVPVTIFQSVATGAILVVAAAVLAALTLLPALLGLLGDRVDALRLPLLRRRTSGQGAGGRGFWYWATRRVMARPAVSLVLAAGLLLAAAVPVLQMETGSSGVATLPDRLPSKQGFVILQREFSGGLVAPVEIVIAGDVASGPVQAAVQRLQTVLSQDADFGPGHLVTNPSGDLALLSVPVAGDAWSNRAMESIRRLRTRHIPEAFSRTDAEVLVTGTTATNTDFIDISGRSTPFVFAFVLSLSLVLLTVAFRSIVVPVKAIVLNLLSVGAAYGLVVLVTQQGVGADLLGFQRVESVEA